ncbi:MAG: hypothetical protein IJ501_03650 [Bacilli bacterium]|nr:hypothetical protein [Bacilli bacterium]
MKKIIYYLRIVLFTLYLIAMFLLIDKIYRANFFCTLYFLLNFIYSFIMILTILSKKKIIKETISYNILNIGIYLYSFMLLKITYSNTTLDILSNEIYFRNNFIMLSILLIGIIIYSLIINKESKKDN